MFDKQLHAVRESWRRQRWEAYLASGRHEVAVMQEVPYNESRVTKVRRFAKGEGKHTVSVLTGAFVSPLHLAKAKESDGEVGDSRCPYCSRELCHFDHVVWECDRCPHSRPAVPECPVQKRLGWDNKPALDLIVAVRKDMLDARYRASRS